MPSSNPLAPYSPFAKPVPYDFGPPPYGYLGSYYFGPNPYGDGDPATFAPAYSAGRHVRRTRAGRLRGL